MRHVWQTPEGRWSPAAASAARWDAFLERADAGAVAAAAHPLKVVAQLLLLNAAVAAAGVGIGVLAGDPPVMLREGMPITWLSVAELGAIALVAWSVHCRAGGRRWHDDFFGLSAIAFTVLAADEATQATVYLSHFLEGRGLEETGGFRDLDAVLLVLLFGTVGLVLLSRAWELRRYPWTVALGAVAVALGIVSQGLDSFLKATEWEFVVEESFKLTAEPFFLGAFLLALARVLSRPSPR